MLLKPLSNLLQLLHLLSLPLPPHVVNGLYTHPVSSATPFNFLFCLLKYVLLANAMPNVNPANTICKIIAIVYRGL